MADIVLETPRLVLRRWRKGDLEAWLTHLNTPEVRAYLGGVDTPDEVAEKFAKLERAWDMEGFSFLAVDRREDGAFLGTCGIARIETECAPEPLQAAIQIGWQFRTDCWGRGYATEAAQEVLAMAFERFDFARIYAQTSQRNRASWRVMERLGMTRLATLDYDDPDYSPEDNPTMVWGIERAAWRAVRAGRTQVPETQIETDRLILRDWRDDDLNALHALCTDSRVMATIGPIHDIDRTRGLLGRLQERRRRDGSTFWAMERREDARVLGFCGTGLGTVPFLAEELEIGWRLASDCWGQSYAREAAEGTLGWIAANRPGRPIWAITWIGNTRSRRLMERLGMRYCEGMDFEHPNVENPELKPHVTYRLDEVR